MEEDLFGEGGDDTGAMVDMTGDSPEASPSGDAQEIKPKEKWWAKQMDELDEVPDDLQEELSAVSTAWIVLRCGCCV